MIKNLQGLSIHQKRKMPIWRFFEILPGLLSWGTLIGSVVLSFIKPVWVALFIICFDIYWLIKALYSAVHLISSYRNLRKIVKVNWLKKCRAIERCDDIYHLIILPTYKEELDVIKPTFEALANANYPTDKMIVVFAGEERDKERAERNAAAIKNLHGDKFNTFLTTIHPQDIPGEIAGKGSNETWAAKQAKKVIDEKGIPYENVMVSVFDVDTCVHPEYFGALTHKFLTTENPHQASYQPVPMFFNNIWDSPALMRVVAMHTTFWMMMEQGKPDKLVTFSSHSMSFKTLVDIGFWDVDIVSEDAHVFWQCLMHYNGEYRVEPLLVPVYMDTVLASTYKESIINQYKQQRRWSWGIEDIPYIFTNFIGNKKISLRKKIKFSFWSLEGFHSWATNAIIIFSLGWLPLIVGGDAFTQTVLAQSLPYITQILMTLAMIGIFISATINMLIIPERPKHKTKALVISMLLQWLLLPIAAIFLGSVPALESQTRMILGKYMGFWVTEKKRKSNAN